MNTKRQRAANLAKPQKSTGPRSSAGRARSAQNAGRHGLTAAPDWSAVTSWFRIFLGDETAEPKRIETDPARHAESDRFDRGGR